MKFKLDENLAPSLASLFVAAGHEAHSVIEQALAGRPDENVLEICRRENRALITFDLDFANIVAYPPANFAGIVILRLRSQAHAIATIAVGRLLELLSGEALAGKLWIIEDHRIRIQG